MEGGLPWLLGIVGEPQVVAGVFSVNQGMAWGLIHLHRGSSHAQVKFLENSPTNPPRII